MTKEEFIEFSFMMGYADKEQAESFCKGYPDDYVFSDDDLFPLYYKNGYGKEGRKAATKALSLLKDSLNI